MEPKSTQTLSDQDNEIIFDLIEVDAAASEMLCNSLGCG